MSLAHFDEVALSNLRAIMKDDFGSLIQTFFRDSAMRIEVLKQAVAAGNSEDIRQAAHTFKGSASNLAAVSLAELCQTLELRGKEQRLECCEELLSQICVEYAHIEKLLAGYLHG